MPARGVADRTLSATARTSPNSNQHLYSAVTVSVPQVSRVPLCLYPSASSDPPQQQGCALRCPARGLPRPLLSTSRATPAAAQWLNIAAPAERSSPLPFPREPLAGIAANSTQPGRPAADRCRLIYN